MFTIWTFGSLVGLIYVIPLLSFGMVLYDFIITKHFDYMTMIKLISIAFGTCMSYYINSYMLISFITEFGPYILFNQVTEQIVKMIFKNIKKCIRKINVLKLTNFYDMVIQIICGILISVVSSSLDNYQLLLLTVSFGTLLIQSTNNIKKMATFIIILLSGPLSHYNINHIIGNIYIYYFLTNILYSETFDYHFHKLKYIVIYKLNKTLFGVKIKKYLKITNAITNDVNKINKSKNNNDNYNDNNNDKIKIDGADHDNNEKEQTSKNTDCNIDMEDDWVQVKQYKIKKNGYMIQIEDYY